MTDSRAATLGAIRAALGRGPLPDQETAALEARLANPAAGVVPGRGRVDAEARIALFIAEAERVSATTARVAGPEAVPAVVARFLREHNLPSTVKLAPDPQVRSIPWSQQSALTVTEGHGEKDDVVGVTGAFCGVAETGTLVLLSGPESPSTLDFLPDTHIALVPAARIFGTYEEAWERVRAERGADGLPRAVHWITGPSRTADIEQTLLLGAHGPRRLHVVIVDARAP